MNMKRLSDFIKTILDDTFLSKMIINIHKSKIESN
jgi:hypothetical protein